MASPFNRNAVNHDRLRDLYVEVDQDPRFEVVITSGGHVRFKNLETGRVAFGPLTPSDGARITKNVTRQLKAIGFERPAKDKQRRIQRVPLGDATIIEPRSTTTTNPTQATFQYGVLEYVKKEDPVVSDTTPEPEKQEKRTYIGRSTWVQDHKSLVKGLKVEDPPKMRPRGAFSKPTARRKPSNEERAETMIQELLLTVATENPNVWVRVPGILPGYLRQSMRRQAKLLELQVDFRFVFPGKKAEKDLTPEEKRTLKGKYWLKVTLPE